MPLMSSEPSETTTMTAGPPETASGPENKQVTPQSNLAVQLANRLPGERIPNDIIEQMKARVLQFHTTSEESFEEALMAGGYGKYKTKHEPASSGSSSGSLSASSSASNISDNSVATSVSSKSASRQSTSTKVQSRPRQSKPLPQIQLPPPPAQVAAPPIVPSPAAPQWVPDVSYRPPPAFVPHYAYGPPPPHMLHHPMPPPWAPHAAYFYPRLPVQQAFIVPRTQSQPPQAPPTPKSPTPLPAPSPPRKSTPPREPTPTFDDLIPLPLEDGPVKEPSPPASARVAVKEEPVLHPTPLEKPSPPPSASGPVPSTDQNGPKTQPLAPCTATTQPESAGKPPLSDKLASAPSKPAAAISITPATLKRARLPSHPTLVGLPEPQNPLRTRPYKVEDDSPPVDPTFTYIPDPKRPQHRGGKNYHLRPEDAIKLAPPPVHLEPIVMPVFGRVLAPVPLPKRRRVVTTTVTTPKVPGPNWPDRIFPWGNRWEERARRGEDALNRFLNRSDTTVDVDEEKKEDDSEDDHDGDMEMHFDEPNPEGWHPATYRD